MNRFVIKISTVICKAVLRKGRFKTVLVYLTDWPAVFSGAQVVSSTTDAPGGGTSQADRGTKYDGGTTKMDRREGRNPDREGKRTDTRRRLRTSHETVGRPQRIPRRNGQETTDLRQTYQVSQTARLCCAYCCRFPGSSAGHSRAQARAPPEQQDSKTRQPCHVLHTGTITWQVDQPRLLFHAVRLCHAWPKPSSFAALVQTMAAFVASFNGKTATSSGEAGENCYCKYSCLRAPRDSFTTFSPRAWAWVILGTRSVWLALLCTSFATAKISFKNSHVLQVVDSNTPILSLCCFF